MTPLKQLVKRASRVADRLLPPPDGITVLIYHRVGGGSDSAVDLDADVFDRQMSHLVEHHRVLTLDDALVELDGSAHSPSDDRRAVVVTFDDGTDDFADHALPVLERHGVPATLYVATQFVDDGIDFPWGAPPATWSALAEAASTGLVAIESHTHTHRLLDRLEPAAIDAELDRSIELIHQHIGSTPKHFAYPKAVPGSPAADLAVRQRFVSAALARSRVNRPGHTDPHRLWRTPIQRSDDTDLFARKAAGGMRLDGELRAMAATIRYRRAES